MKKKPSFSGYATKNDVKCTDGRVIKRDAFKDIDGEIVPLVWQHMHGGVENVLGHALLENREDGVYAYGYFNDTPAGLHAEKLVKHGDINSLSIFANSLVQKGSDVVHGVIREVSLVLAGANPLAKIDNLVFAHGDGSEIEDPTEAFLLFNDIVKVDVVEHADDGRTMEDVFNTLSEEQKEVVYAMLAAVSGAIEHDDMDEDDEDENDEDDEDDEDLEHSHKSGGKSMKKNVFDKEERKASTLTHAQFGTIMADAVQMGSFKAAVLAHATEYGIENIDVLFPDAQTLSKDPDWLKREDDWVAGILAMTRKSPFSRIKSIIADMDIDTARAKGYIKATLKKEVYFKVAKRVTTPVTVYVKQKLDRDDIIDVTDFDIVAMVRFQLRTLLDEELAMAILLGDGREPNDPYKINEDNIRPIWTDDDLYANKVLLTTKTDYKKMVKEIAFSDDDYKGSGSPTFYTTAKHRTNMLWIEDGMGRRLYESEATLCAALGVARIVIVPPIEGKTRVVDTKTRELIGIKVNLKDYNCGADKGGQIASFDDFDIDFNQYKYLMETRMSGALVKPNAAQIYEFEIAG